MIPPQDSGSSDSDSNDQKEEINTDYISTRMSSSLSSNADENELDALLHDFETNPIEDITADVFYGIDEQLSEQQEFQNSVLPIEIPHFSPIDQALTSTTLTTRVDPKPSTPGNYKKIIPKRSSKRLLNYNIRTPPIPLPSLQPSPISELDLISPQHQIKNKIEHMQFVWKNENKFNFEIDVPNYEFYTQNKEVLTPYLYFKKFFSDDVFDLIVQETNIYSFQKFGKSINISSAELADFLSIQLWMSVIKVPAYTDYWSNLMGITKISDIMTLKKYQQILRSLHFKNNDEYDPSDRFNKIRPLLNLIRRNCLNHDEGNRYSIDEMMVPYKGTKAGSRRQYVKSKPKKWGFKFFIRAGINGQIFDILPYGGESTFTDFKFSENENKYFGLGGKVVLALASTIPKKPLSVVYYDNFFTSPELVHHLRKEYGILSLGTVQQNRLRNCPLLDEKTLKKKR